MKLVETKKIFHNDQEFHIKSFLTENEFVVRVFKDNKPANPYTYKVEFSIANDYELWSGENAHERIIKTAIEDVENGMIFGDKL